MARQVALPQGERETNPQAIFLESSHYSMTESEEGETTWETPPLQMVPSSSKIVKIETMHAGVSPDDSIRDTRPILEDSIRGDLAKMTDEQLRAVWNWSTSWTQDHVSAVKRWVARGPIQDEIDRRHQKTLESLALSLYKSHQDSVSDARGPS